MTCIGPFPLLCEASINAPRDPLDNPRIMQQTAEWLIRVSGPRVEGGGMVGSG